MNKKAISAVTGIIITIIVFLILAIFFTSIKDQLNQETSRWTCMKSVETQALTQPAGGLINSPFDIKCRRYHVKFFEDHVEIDGKTREVTVNGKSTKKFDKLTEDIVNQVLAQELALCWSQFHNGKLDIFDKKKADILNHRAVCFICDTVEFDYNIQTPRFKNFYTYLRDTENVGFGGTYYDYLSAERICDGDYEKQGNCWEAYFDASIPGAKDLHDPLTRDIQFSKDRKYYIFFVREGIRVNAQGTYFSYIIPESELNNQCDEQVRSI